MISRAEITGQVLRLLNKGTANRGVYTTDKVNDALQEAADALAVQMMMGDNGWQTKLRYLATTSANQQIVPLPSDVILIKEVRILGGDGTYFPIAYDAKNGEPRSAPGQGGLGGPCAYSIIDNCLWFDPPLADAQPKAILLECMVFPKITQDDEDFLEAHFHPCFRHFIKYRTATILQAGFSNGSPSWAALEASWTNAMVAMVEMRNRQVTPIREAYP